MGSGVRLGARPDGEVERVRSLAGASRSYAAALEPLTAAAFAAPALRGLQDALRSDGQPAPQAIRRLDRLVRLAQPASSMVYPVIELTTLWNVHVLNLLEGWQAQHGARTRGWLSALGEAEALAALARP